MNLLMKASVITGAVIDMKKAVLTIKDGTDTPLSATVKIGEGTLQWSEKYNQEYILDAGVLDSVRAGDEVPLEVSFDAMYDYIVSIAGDTTVYELITNNKNGGEGGDGGCESTDDEACNSYACDLEFVHTPTPSSCGDIETIIFPTFRVESISFDPKGGKISFSGKCNVIAPTITRSSQGA